MKKNQFPYLHGFSKEEQQRLRDQAQFAEFAVYQNVDFTESEHILEIGVGVGAQSEILLRRFPKLKITGIDASAKQLEAAKYMLEKTSFYKNRFDLKEMNAEKMLFKNKTFDGAFLCWILEHVKNPKNVLAEAKRVLKPGSPIYITEVLNSSFFLDPYSPCTWRYWMIFNDYQFENAGDPFIGAKLGNLLVDLDFKDINIQIKTWHFDKRNPERRKKTIIYWTNLLLSAKDLLLEKSLVDEKLVKGMQKELHQVVNNPDAVFFYSFAQASAIV
jgi:ubiquinone/menaquinone biosynthesis C-methylase UbiE